MSHEFASRPLVLSLVTMLSIGCDLPGKESSGESGGEPDPSGTSTTVAEGSDTEPAPEPMDRAVDILFVVDNSGSMGTAQSKLATGIGTLVNALDAAVPPVDYRIGVTTTDSGNPWCSGTGVESGALRATSCRERTNEFVFNGSDTVDVTEEACLSVCERDELGLAQPWIEVNGSDGTNNVPDGQVVEALRCMLPQGISGCGFEQPLESLRRALLRAAEPGDVNYGFRRPGAQLAVAIVTDEADCSFADENIFLPEGNRTFWSNPDGSSPTSAVCWRAGVQCTGEGPYDCAPANYDHEGVPVADDSEAVLHGLSRYITLLEEQGAYVTAINGVRADGSVHYDDTGLDPQFQHDFGIDPGCSIPSTDAVPPVRVKSLIETVTGPDPGNMHSICNESFSPAMSSIANGIIARLPL